MITIRLIKGGTRSLDYSSYIDTSTSEFEDFDSDFRLAGSVVEVLVPGLESRIESGRYVEGR